MIRFLLLACLAVLATQTFAASRCGGPNSHSCVTSTAACEGDQCVCTSPYIWGDGRFGCYKKNTVAAELKNDPTLTNFSNQTIKFPFPCRFLVTHVKQELKDRNRDVIGNCEFKIHSFNGKAKGKYFTHGFDIAVRINYDSGKTVEMSARSYGTADNGVYSFAEEATDGAFLPNGPWGGDDIGYRDDENDIDVKQFIDHDNNQLVFEFNKCGLRASLTPYDLTARRSQVSIPGLAIAINCAMHPVWLSPNEVMALPPAMDGGQTFEDIQWDGISVEQSVVARAFVQEYQQNQPWNDGGQCLAGSQALGYCSTNAKREAAFDMCYWILKEPRFVKCYDKTYSGQEILDLFNSCIEEMCVSGTCADAKWKISNKGCANVKRISKLSTFNAMC